MQIIMEDTRLTFQGQVWELAEFWAGLREQGLGELTLREYLRRQLH